MQLVNPGNGCLCSVINKWTLSRKTSRAPNSIRSSMKYAFTNKHWWMKSFDVHRMVLRDQVFYSCERKKNRSSPFHGWIIPRQYNWFKRHNQYSRETWSWLCTPSCHWARQGDTCLMEKHSDPYCISTSPYPFVRLHPKAHCYIKWTTFHIQSHILHIRVVYCKV